MISHVQGIANAQAFTFPALAIVTIETILYSRCWRRTKMMHGLHKKSGFC
jgi:hypothetical protein